MAAVGLDVQPGKMGDGVAEDPAFLLQPFREVLDRLEVVVVRLGASTFLPQASQISDDAGRGDVGRGSPPPRRDHFPDVGERLAHMTRGHVL